MYELVYVHTYLTIIVTICIYIHIHVHDVLLYISHKCSRSSQSPLLGSPALSELRPLCPRQERWRHREHGFQRGETIEPGKKMG